ncbi:MAG: tetratricopeptide repeat protein, partial [Planctomycetaceae bacterium]|nr:tetratricopeptide repeat protein [Planctomycetaceae bacterium]
MIVAKRLELFGRGNAWFAMENYENAIQDFSEAIQLNNQEGKYFYRRGISFCEKKDYEKGIEDLSELLRLNPMDS